MGQPKSNKFNKSLDNKGKNSDLKMKRKSNDYGCLVFAVIADYKGKGKQRVILHEVELLEGIGYSYGHKRSWNFPVKESKTR